MVPHVRSLISRIPGSPVVLLAAAIAFATGAPGCRKKRTDEVATPPATSASPATTATPASAAPAAAPPKIERFLAALPREGGGVEVAAIARDRSVVLARLDAELRAASIATLARGIDATEPSEIAIAEGGLVVVVGRIGEARGAFLLREGQAPRPIGLDRCAARAGVAWLERQGGTARVRAVHAHDGKLDEFVSAPISAAAESEVHLACGPDQVVVSVRDGEQLALASLGFDAATFAAPKLVQIEREGELEDELRDRTILPRAGRAVAIVRIGTEAISYREIDGASLGAWTTVSPAKGASAKEAVLAEDADLLESAASPRASGPVWVLASEPAGGKCPGGDPPRRLVLRELKPAAGKATQVTAVSRPVVELPCGVDAVRMHLLAEASRATMWWTEPVDGKSCAHPGLTASAVVSAASDRPGARRAAIVAEGIEHVDGERFLAVVRPDGCVPWAAPGNGALVWAPPAK